MGEESLYYYRGTTIGWPGNESLIIEGMTCTTTDPLVATLFAIQCRNHGKAVILVAPQEPFTDLIGRPNFFPQLECAVNLKVLPAEFARHAVFRLDVDRSLEILSELEFDGLPVRIESQTALFDALEASELRSHRLSLEQLRLFNRRMFEVD